MTEDQRDNSVFGEMLSSPMPVPDHAYIKIDFARPAGEGIFSSVYDMRSLVDVGTINRNLADGYRVIKICMEDQ